jgi:ornithine carbamoyltransferase
VRIAAPSGYEPDAAIAQRATEIAVGSQVLVTQDPIEAVKGAHVVYTDVWASMGQEDLAEGRLPIFQQYQVNEQLLSHADERAIVLHCLPAHRGEEITDEVMEGAKSLVWDQAENRLHAQKALLASLLGAS